ncbi:MAG TPA: type II toxin-antitoxin system VapC family toxin [Thermoanaerobaculia bacterium]|nr:type II toxin-antitoxin system VapC family toxin [Thermoanaerobaculia bacterium]
MIAYLDSSVIMRLVFEEPDTLEEWSQIDSGLTSVLTRIECARTLQRYRARHPRKRASVDTAQQSAVALLSNMLMLPISDDVLERAADAIDHPLGTLDALHLATAMHYRDTSAAEIHFATHDRELADAARALGFPTLGA